ncbi:MAG: hypothetical protein ACE5JZ_10025, partial [Kiloniellales bacterium]
AWWRPGIARGADESTPTRDIGDRQRIAKPAPAGIFIACPLSRLPLLLVLGLAVLGSAIAAGALAAVFREMAAAYAADAAHLQTGPGRPPAGAAPINPRYCADTLAYKPAQGWARARPRPGAGTVGLGIIQGVLDTLGRQRRDRWPERTEEEHP